jgi:hypothetical protein
MTEAKPRGPDETQIIEYRLWQGPESGTPFVDSFHEIVMRSSGPMTILTLHVKPRTHQAGHEQRMLLDVVEIASAPEQQVKSKDPADKVLTMCCNLEDLEPYEIPRRHRTIDRRNRGKHTD